MSSPLEYYQPRRGRLVTVDAYESEVDLEVRLGYTLDTTYTRKQTSYDPPRRIRILPNRHLELT